MLGREAPVSRRTNLRASPAGIARLALSGAIVAALCAGGCGPVTTLPPPVPPAATRPASAPSTTANPTIPEPSADNPVTAAAWLSPGEIAPGTAAELRVRVRIAAGHYLHAAGTEPPFVPTSIELAPSDAVRPACDWEITRGADAAGRLSGTVEFRRRVRVAEGAAAGRHDLACGLTFQACTPELCWPPRVLKLRASFTVNTPAAPATPPAAPTPDRTKETQ